MKSRAIISHAPTEYNLPDLLGYVLYPPLYLSGPTLSYNTYLSLLKNPTREVTTSYKLLYLARLLLGLVYLEAILSMTYPFAFAALTYNGSIPPEITLSNTWFTLCCMYLKFQTLWRVARGWCLVDGMDVNENMIRVWNDNYNIQGFWKNWHASFNKWLVRYIYIPTGGNKMPAVSVTLTFLFVAIWHDVEMKLVAWGLLNAAFFVFEKGCMQAYYGYCEKRRVDRTRFGSRLLEGMAGGGEIAIASSERQNTQSISLARERAIARPSR